MNLKDLLPKNWASSLKRQMAERAAATSEARAERTLDLRRSRVEERHLGALNQVRPMATSTAYHPGLGGPQYTLQDYTPPKGVAPASRVLTMDANGQSYPQRVAFFTSMGFPGFPYLAELTQISEYRDMTERVAGEMTRKFIKLRSKSKQDKSETIKRIEAGLKKFHVKEIMHEAAVLDGFFGRAQIFIDLGNTGESNEDKSELKAPLLINKYKIDKGSLRGFRTIEPITTYPADYNASNPLRQDYYNPASWFVYGQEVHCSRLLTIVSRPLPDLLKPVYNFSGMSLSQLAEPYVRYWLSTRDSVGKLLKNFSTTVLSTDLSTMLSDPDSEGELIKRMRFFVAARDNQGVFLANKLTEEIGQHNIPLSGLDKLQAQAQEHMAAVAKTPLVILTGITPAGLNNSQDSEIRIFHEYVRAQQEQMFRAPLETIINVIQLSEIGELDDDIIFEFVDLYEMNGEQLSKIRKSDGEAGAVYIQSGVITPEEERNRLAADPTSGYDNLDMNAKVPQPTGEQDSELGKEAMTNIKGNDENLKGRVIQDHNPAGTNQHTSGYQATITAGRATAKALKASKASRHTNNAMHHSEAHAAHVAAHQAHAEASKTGKDALRPWHEQMAIAHAVVASHHSLGQHSPVKFGKTYGDIPEVTQ